MAALRIREENGVVIGTFTRRKPEPMTSLRIEVSKGGFALHTPYSKELVAIAKSERAHWNPVSRAWIFETIEAAVDACYRAFGLEPDIPVQLKATPKLELSSEERQLLREVAHDMRHKRVVRPELYAPDNSTFQELYVRLQDQGLGDAKDLFLAMSEVYEREFTGMLRDNKAPETLERVGTEPEKG